MFECESTSIRFQDRAAVDRHRVSDVKGGRKAGRPDGRTETDFKYSKDANEQASKARMERCTYGEEEEKEDLALTFLLHNEV